MMPISRTAPLNDRRVTIESPASCAAPPSIRSSPSPPSSHPSLTSSPPAASSPDETQIHTWARTVSNENNNNLVEATTMTTLTRDNNTDSNHADGDLDDQDVVVGFAATTEEANNSLSRKKKPIVETWLRTFLTLYCYGLPVFAEIGFSYHNMKYLMEDKPWVYLPPGSNPGLSKMIFVRLSPDDVPVEVNDPSQPTTSPSWELKLRYDEYECSLFPPVPGGARQDGSWEFYLTSTEDISPGMVERALLIVMSSIRWSVALARAIGIVTRYVDGGSASSYLLYLFALIGQCVMSLSLIGMQLSDCSEWWAIGAPLTLLNAQIPFWIVNAALVCVVVILAILKRYHILGCRPFHMSYVCGDQAFFCCILCFCGSSFVPAIAVLLVGVVKPHIVALLFGIISTFLDFLVPREIQHTSHSLRTQRGRHVNASGVSPESDSPLESPTITTLTELLRELEMVKDTEKHRLQHDVLELKRFRHEKGNILFERLDGVGEVVTPQPFFNRLKNTSVTHTVGGESGEVSEREELGKGSKLDEGGDGHRDERQDRNDFELTDGLAMEVRGDLKVDKRVAVMKLMEQNNSEGVSGIPLRPIVQPCYICLDEESCVVFEPCQHGSICFSCLMGLVGSELKKRQEAQRRMIARRGRVNRIMNETTVTLTRVNNVEVVNQLGGTGRLTEPQDEQLHGPPSSHCDLSPHHPHPPRSTRPLDLVAPPLSASHSPLSPSLSSSAIHSSVSSSSLSAPHMPRVSLSSPVSPIPAASEIVDEGSGPPCPYCRQQPTAIYKVLGEICLGVVGLEGEADEVAGRRCDAAGTNGKELSVLGRPAAVGGVDPLSPSSPRKSYGCSDVKTGCDVVYYEAVCLWRKPCWLRVKSEE
eukprot:GHVN01052670.1.p1 GENE.GHVN01052670.1~~GHVN01052670.1.p1  ORF type:complete len:871 (+),score=182.13 GHVN01052670.1:569-3181(+)